MHNKLSKDYQIDFLSARLLSSGSACQLYLLKDSANKLYVSKVYNDTSHRERICAEATGLALLKEKSSLMGGVQIVQVIGHNDFSILMDYVEQTQGNRQSFYEAGRKLALMHQASENYFGLASGDNYIGPTKQNNSIDHDWGEFYFHKRLLFQALLTKRSELVESLQQYQEKIISLLNDSGPRSCLLHGDLWSGNLLFDEQGRATLIDPAVYYGDFEAELAMCRLFGGFLPEFYSGYRSITPKRVGEEKRCFVYTLYHLLNHLNIFGRGYLAQVERCLREIARI